MRPTLLLTGATGFIGRQLLNRLSVSGKYEIRIALRNSRPSHDVVAFCDPIEVGNIDAKTSWDLALYGVDIVVHLAGRAHVLRESDANPIGAFHAINVEGTQKLAEAAAKNGVKRFVYLSSIGVNGYKTMQGYPFTELDSPLPHNAYTISKWEAEQELRRISLDSSMEIVIIRPPLVYGSSPPGNLEQLLKILKLGVPLPFNRIENLRSLVSLENLVDFIEVCCEHLNAGNQTFLVSDGEDISTVTLIGEIAEAGSLPVRLFSLPLWILSLGAALLNRRSQFQSLCGNLQVDISKARQLLGWAPTFTVREGVHRMFSSQDKK